MASPPASFVDALQLPAAEAIREVSDGFVANFNHQLGLQDLAGFTLEEITKDPAGDKYSRLLFFKDASVSA